MRNKAGTRKRWIRREHKPSWLVVKVNPDGTVKRLWDLPSRKLAKHKLKELGSPEGVVIRPGYDWGSK